MVIQFAKDMKSKFLTPIIQEVQNKGVQLKSTTKTDASIPDIYYSWMSRGYTGIMHNDKYSYKQYTLIAPAQTTTITTPNATNVNTQGGGLSTLLEITGEGSLVYFGLTLLLKKEYVKFLKQHFIELYKPISIEVIE